MLPLPEESKSHNSIEISYHITVSSDTASNCSTSTIQVQLTLDEHSSYDDPIQMREEIRAGYCTNKYDSEEPDDMRRNGFERAQVPQ